MSKNTVIIVIITAIIVLATAPKLRQLPGVKMIPTV